MSKNHSHGGLKAETAPGASPAQAGSSGADGLNQKDKSPLSAENLPEEPCQGSAGEGMAPEQAGTAESCPVCGETGDEKSGGEAGNEPGPEEIIADLEAQLAEAKDQFLRKAADFENFRKRMNREKQDAIEFANQGLLLDLIPIIDDFDRAMLSAETSKDFGSLYEGIGMIEKRLISQLESKWGLKRFDSAGEVFDPNRHEALMMEKSAEITDPVVKEDLLKGYTLKDRVIRSAKVKVLMPETEAQNGPKEGEG